MLSRVAMCLSLIIYFSRLNILLSWSLQIGKVTETSLSANQERTKMEKKRLIWKVEGSSSSRDDSKLARGRPVDPKELVVELAPMEIRTFVIDFDHKSYRRVFDA